jgi:hypothetical protein
VRTVQFSCSASRHVYLTQLSEVKNSTESELFHKYCRMVPIHCIVDHDRLIRIPCVLCYMRVRIYWERPRLSVYMYENIYASLEPDDCHHAPAILRALRINSHLITDDASILQSKGGKGEVT